MSTAPLLTAQDVESLQWDDLEPARPKKRTDVRREDGYLDSWDGTKLFWQSWQSSEDVASRGRIVLVHGYGEHSARYDHVATLFARAGYPVMALDVRGHGRSSGIKAHVAHYDDYVRDVERFVGHVQARWSDDMGPMFVLGHSNGGLISLRYALRRPEGIAGFVITSPLCGLSVKVPAWKAKAGVVMSKLWPSFALPSELDASFLTHDKHVVQTYIDDPLVSSEATARWFTEVQQAFGDLRERASLIRQPLLMLLSGQDKLVDADASQRVFERLGSDDTELGLYEDLYHEILNELPWKEIATRIVLWLERQRAGVEASLEAGVVDGESE